MAWIWFFEFWFCLEFRYSDLGFGGQRYRYIDTLLLQNWMVAYCILIIGVAFCHKSSNR